MKSLSNLKIGTRLSLGFGIVLVCMLALGAFALNGLSRSNAELRSIVDKDVMKLESGARGRGGHAASAFRALELALVADPAQRRHIVERMSVNSKRAGDAIATLDPWSTSRRARRSWQGQGGTQRLLRFVSGKVQELVAAGKSAEALEVAKTDMDVKFSKLAVGLLEMGKLQKQLLRKGIQKSDADYADSAVCRWR